MWAEVTLAAICSFAVLGVTAIITAYPWPPKLIEQYAVANQVAIPSGTASPNGDAVCMAADEVVICPKASSTTPAMPYRC